MARAQRELGDALALLDQEHLLLPGALRVCPKKVRIVKPIFVKPLLSRKATL